jgi:ribonuclease G
MHKELIIATTSQESKLAILEDDELVEYYIERRRSQGIVGNIYKGRVTKVLPGMQSAFVDIGLERDAFLYVSDFLEDTDEYEKIVATVEAEVASLQDPPVKKAMNPAIQPVIAPLPAPAAVSIEVPEADDIIPRESVMTVASIETDAVSTEVVAAKGEERPERPGGGRRDRPGDRGRGGGGKKPRIPSFEPRPSGRPGEVRHGESRGDSRVESRGESRGEARGEARNDDRPWGTIEALPGESLAK